MNTKNRNYSAIYKHSSDADHKINYENPKVLASDNIKIRLQVKETLLIKAEACPEFLKGGGPISLGSLKKVIRF